MEKTQRSGTRILIKFERKLTETKAVWRVRPEASLYMIRLYCAAIHCNYRLVMTVKSILAYCTNQPHDVSKLHSLKKYPNFKMLVTHNLKKYFKKYFFERLTMQQAINRIESGAVHFRKSNSDLLII